MSEFRFTPKRTPQEAADRIDLSSPTAKGLAGLAMSLVADVRQMQNEGKEVPPELMKAALYWREMSSRLTKRLEEARESSEAAVA